MALWMAVPFSVIPSAAALPKNIAEAEARIADAEYAIKSASNIDEAADAAAAITGLKKEDLKPFAERIYNAENDSLAEAAAQKLAEQNAFAAGADPDKVVLGPVEETGSRSGWSRAQLYEQNELTVKGRTSAGIKNMQTMDVVYRIDEDGAAELKKGQSLAPPLAQRFADLLAEKYRQTVRLDYNGQSYQSVYDASETKQSVENLKSMLKNPNLTPQYRERLEAQLQQRLDEGEQQRKQYAESEIRKLEQRIAGEKRHIENLEKAKHLYGKKQKLINPAEEVISRHQSKLSGLEKLLAVYLNETGTQAETRQTAQPQPGAWTDPETGLEVRLDKQTGKPYIAVKRNQEGKPNPDTDLSVTDPAVRNGVLQRYAQARQTPQAPDTSAELLHADDGTSAQSADTRAMADTQADSKTETGTTEKSVKENYRQDLRQALEKTLNPGKLIRVSSAPEVYGRKGLPVYPIVLPQYVIPKVTVDKHAVGMDIIERLPELLNSPVMLLNSLTDPKTFIAVIDAVDKDGKPIVVAQKPTLKQITNILSIYGKDNFDNFIKNCIEKGKVIAVDKNKATKYVRPQELQLLKGTLLDDLFLISSNSAERSSALDDFVRAVKALLPADTAVTVDSALKQKGSYDFVNNIAKVRDAHDLETVIHEIGHAYASTLTADQIKAWAALEKTVKDKPNPKGRAHNFDLTTREGQEQFVDRLLQYIRNEAEQAAKPDTKTGSLVRELAGRFKQFLKEAWAALKRIGRNSPEINAWFEQNLGKPQTRNEELIQKLRENLKSELDGPVSHGDAAVKIVQTAQELTAAGHPVDALKAQARQITGDAAREQAFKELDALARLYPPETNQYLAPNGNPSNLTPAQWYAVRTPGFKQRSGDWEARENAKIKRMVNSLTEAEKVLTAEKIVGKPLNNAGFNITAAISGNSLGKLTSVKALNKSVSPKIHALAVANIDSLFENAQIDVTHPDLKDNIDIKQIHRLGTLLEYDDKFYPVKITVKEFKQKNDGTRIYSVEAVDIESIMNSAGQLASSQNETDQIVPIAEFNNKILELYDSVKRVSSAGLDANGEPVVPPDALGDGAMLYSLDETDSDFEEIEKIIQFGKENPRVVTVLNNEISYQHFSAALDAVERLEPGISGADFQEARDRYLKDNFDVTGGAGINGVNGYNIEILGTVFDLVSEYRERIDELRNSTSLAEAQAKPKKTTADFMKLVESGEFLNDLITMEDAYRNPAAQSAETGQSQAALRQITSHPTISSAVQKLRTGKGLDERHKKKLETLIRNRAALYQNAYAAVTDNEEWMNPLTPENIREMLGTTAYSPEEIEKIIEKADAETAEKLLLNGARLPAQKEIDAYDKSLQEKLDKKEKQLKDMEEEIKEYDEYIELNKRTVEKYRELAKLSRLTGDRDAHKRLKTAAVSYAQGLAAYDRLLKKIKKTSAQNLSAMLDVVLDIQKIRGQERAVQDIKRYTDKTLYNLLRKPKNDILVSYKDRIEDIHTVIGNPALKRYISGLHTNMFRLNDMINDYKNDEAFRSSIRSSLDDFDTQRLEALIKKPWEDLSRTEKRELGTVFAQEGVQQARVNEFVQQIQEGKINPESIKSILTRQDAQRLHNILFDKAGNKRPVAAMQHRSKAWIVRRVTGQPEWSESLVIQEADSKAVEEASARLQESGLLDGEVKALLAVDAYGNPVFDPQKRSDVETLAIAVDRLRRDGRQIKEDIEEERRERYRAGAGVLEKQVPNFMGGRPYSSYPGYKGEWKQGERYKKGDKAEFSNLMYEALEDTDADIGSSSWKGLWSPGSEKRGFFQKMFDTLVKTLDADLMAQYQFQEGGLKPGEGNGYNILIRPVRLAKNIMNAHIARRKTAFIKKMESLQIKESEYSAHTYHLGDADVDLKLGQVQYLWAAAKNRYAYRAALAEFLSGQEIRNYTEGSDEVRKEILNRGKKRYQDLIDWYDDFITKPEHRKFHKLLEYILDELQENYPRLREFMEREYNFRVKYEENYLPLRRIFTGGFRSSDEQINDLTETMSSKSLDKGMTIDRTDAALGQSRINYNLFDVYFQHIDQAEKLMAYTPWIRQWKHLFDSGRSPEAQSLRRKIEAAYGKEGLEFWQKVMRDELNSNAYKSDGLIDKVMFLLRGKYVKGAVLGRASSLVTQLVTSTAASMTEVGPLELLEGIGIFNSGVMKSMLNLSPYMAGRWNLAELEKAGENTAALDDYKDGKWDGLKPLDRKVDRIAARLLNGADRTAVAPVFHAVYMREMKKAVKESNNAILLDEKNPYKVYGDDIKAVREAQSKALELAELVISRTQPDQDNFTQPLFMHNKTGAAGFLTDFAKPFIKLFNNAWWTVGQKLFGKNRDFAGNIAMVLWGMAFTGVTMAIMGFLRDEEKEELKDADAETRRKHILSWLLGGYGIAGNLPIIGMMAGSLAEAVIKGKFSYSAGSGISPVYGNIQRLLRDILTDDPEAAKIIADAVRIALQFYGTGYGMFNDVTAAFEMEDADNLERVLRVLGVR